MINENGLQNSPKASLKQRGDSAVYNTFTSTFTDGFNASVENPTSSVENLYKEGVLDPLYYTKTLVLNDALQEIGMGKYQVLMTMYMALNPPLMCCRRKYKLLLVAGMGWFA
jgi:hypothetical protein